MVKFRARLLKKTVIVTLTNSDIKQCCLAELRDEIKKNFAIDDFDLSLNRKEILPRDNSPLADLGLISGDLIHVLVNQNDSPVCKKSETVQKQTKNLQPADKHLPTAEELRNKRLKYLGEQPTVKDTQQQQKQEVTNRFIDTMTSSAEQIVNSQEVEEGQSPVNYAEINRYLNEPLLLRESTSKSVPLSLHHLFSTTDIQSPHDALFVALHILMIETGFQMKEGNPASLPEGWKQSGGIKKLQYLVQSSSSEEPANVTLMYIELGNTAKAYCTVENSNEEPNSCQLKCKDYIRDLIITKEPHTTYKNLRKLTIIFKDKVSYPVLQCFSRDLIPDLTNLPVEVQLEILKYLKMPELVWMSEVCKHMYSVSNETILWRRLYLKEFGKRNDSNDLTLQWKKLYQEKYMQQRELAVLRRKNRQQMMFSPPIIYPQPIPGVPLPTPGFPGFPQPAPPGMFRPPMHPMYTPGSIGGEIDRDPLFAGVAGILGPGGMHQPPQLLPRPARFDPFAPMFPNPQRPMGPGRGMWEATSEGAANGGGRGRGLHGRGRPSGLLGNRGPRLF